MRSLGVLRRDDKALDSGGRAKTNDKTANVASVMDIGGFVLEEMPFKSK